VGAFVFLFVSSPLRAQEQVLRTASLTSERQLQVNVEGGFGTLQLRRGPADAVYAIKSIGEEEKNQHVSVSYNVKDHIGVLHIELNTNADEDGLSDLIHLFKGNNGGQWRLELTDQIPIDYRMEFGAGDADLDFSGLKISNLQLETGASSLSIRMKSPNPERVKLVIISAGLGSIHSESLGNLNFEKFRFEGGLGSYTLDLGGAMRDGARISAEVGLGSLDILIPESIGVRASCDESWLSSARFPRFERIDNERYQTPNYSSASRRISMSLESGIGSVSVRWKK
jgi:hypothetical protein